MASVVDICNTGLGHVGNSARLTSLDDLFVEADYCRTWYPIARDQMLASHAWGFATRRVALALLSESDVAHWRYLYAKPGLCVTPLGVYLPEEYDDANTQDYVLESNSAGAEVIYSNVEDAVLKYVHQVEDTTRFSALFVVALGVLLGSYLARVIPKDLKLAASLLQEWRTVALPDAIGADANAQQVSFRRDHTPAHLKARGVSLGTPPATIVRG